MESWAKVAKLGEVNAGSNNTTGRLGDTNQGCSSREV